jgi:hypothetical protein
MKHHHQPWRLCRNFGSPPVGSVFGARWPKGSHGLPRLPPQSSRWTFSRWGAVQALPRSSNTQVEDTATKNSEPRHPFQGRAIVRSSSRVSSVSVLLLNSPVRLATARNPPMPIYIKRPVLGFARPALPTPSQNR